MISLRWLALASALTLAACGGTDDSSRPTTSPTPPEDAGAPTPPVARTMGTARAMGSRPENLVLDPMFGSLGGTYAENVIAQDASALLEVPATSPAGPSQPVVLLSPTGESPLLVLQVQGGSGPLDVRIFIAGEKPATVTLLDGQFTKSYDIPLSSDGSEVHGDRTYQLFHAVVTEPLLGKLWLMVNPNGTDLHIAAPEVTSPEAPAITFAKVISARRVPLGRHARAAQAAVRAVPVFHGARIPKVPLRGAVGLR